MKDVLIIVGFSLASALFFASNELGRGEFGGLLYTSTKCFPILLLCFFTRIFFIDEQNLGRNTGLAFLLGAAGDLFLATRSISTTNFNAGMVPFAFNHWFNVQTMAVAGIKYSTTCLIPLLIHAVFMGVVTFGKFETAIVQIFATTYSFFLLAASWIAFSMWFHDPSKLSNKMRALGYLVFVISDSLLTIDAYVVPVAKSQMYVMITYYAAQLFIFLGSFYLEREWTSKKLKSK